MTSEKFTHTPAPTTGTVVITRRFDALAEHVFDAWLNPAVASRWLFATPDGKMLRVEIDARVGGGFTVIEQRGDIAAEHLGTYLEIERPRRLVFNFSLPQYTKVATRVTVEIAPRGAGCELTLTHEGVLADYLDRVKHGWSGIFDHLTTLVTETEREIVISRIFDAPRELVWEAWTNPRHVAQWWGPVGFSTTIQEMDVRPGGAWKQVMHGPDGTDYPSQSIFSEVVKPERIVFSDAGGKAGGPGVHFVSTWIFDKLGEQTRVTIRMVFPSTADRNMVAKEFGAIEGGKQTLGRLAKLLPTLVTADAREFVLTREFEAPRALVWKAWSEPERLAQWWGPKGFAMLVAKLDFRAGGSFHYCMEAPGSGPMAGKMWGLFAYREIVAPERIVFVNSFSNAEGGLTRHPLSATWPLEVLNVLTFTEQNGCTTLTLRGGPINATAEERATFLSAFEGMQKGFGGTLDQLAAYLAQAKG